MPPGSQHVIDHDIPRGRVVLHPAGGEPLPAIPPHAPAPRGEPPPGTALVTLAVAHPLVARDVHDSGVVAVRVTSPGEPPQRVPRRYGVILQVNVVLAAHRLEPIREGVPDTGVAPDPLRVGERVEPVPGCQSGAVNRLVARVEQHRDPAIRDAVAGSQRSQRLPEVLGAVVRGDGDVHELRSSSANWANRLFPSVCISDSASMLAPS